MTQWALRPADLSTKAESAAGIPAHAPLLARKLWARSRGSGRAPQLFLCLSRPSLSAPLAGTALALWSDGLQAAATASAAARGVGECSSRRHGGWRDGARTPETKCWQPSLRAPAGVPRPHFHMARSASSAPHPHPAPHTSGSARTGTRGAGSPEGADFLRAQGCPLPAGIGLVSLGFSATNGLHCFLHCGHPAETRYMLLHTFPNHLVSLPGSVRESRAQIATGPARLNLQSSSHRVKV